ncbi:MAG: oligosaccharide flippase family protein [Desulfonatronovibrio sp.]
MLHLIEEIEHLKSDFSSHTYKESEEGKEIYLDVWKRVISNLHFQFFSVILGYVISIIWAKNLGLHHFGFYSIAATIATLLGILLPLGYNTTSTLIFPPYLKDKKWSLYRGLVFYSYKLVSISSILVLLGAGGLILFLDMSSFNSHIFILTAIWGVSAAFTSLISSQLQGQQRFTASYFYTIFLQPLLVLVGIGILYAIGGSFQTLSAVVITIAAQGVLLILLFGVFIFGNAPSVPKVSPQYDTQKWKHFSYSAVIMTSFLIIINRADLIFLNIFISHQAAGIYMAVLLTSSFLAVPFKAFKSSMGPSLAHLAHSKRFDLMQTLETYSARRCFVLTLVLAIILIVFAHPLLGHFGDHQGRGFFPFLLLALTWVILAGVGSPGSIMLITGKNKRYLQILISITILDIILLFFVVPEFGLVGAALVSSLCLCLNRILGSVAAHKECYIHTSILGASLWPKLQETQIQIAEQASKS